MCIRWLLIHPGSGKQPEHSTILRPLIGTHYTPLCGVLDAELCKAPIEDSLWDPGDENWAMRSIKGASGFQGPCAGLAAWSSSLPPEPKFHMHNPV